jgi:hypothetical protein
VSGAVAFQFWIHNACFTAIQIDNQDNQLIAAVIPHFTRIDECRTLQRYQRAFTDYAVLFLG